MPNPVDRAGLLAALWAALLGVLLAGLPKTRLMRPAGQRSS